MLNVTDSIDNDIVLPYPTWVAITIQTKLSWREFMSIIFAAFTERAFQDIMNWPAMVWRVHGRGGLKQYVYQVTSYGVEVEPHNLH